MPPNQASDTKIDQNLDIRVRYLKRDLGDYTLRMPSTVLNCCLGWYSIIPSGFRLLDRELLAKNLENPREQWSSPHFLHGENQARVIRTNPITLIFTQYITKGLVDLRFTGIYKILSELGGVGRTKRCNSRTRISLIFLEFCIGRSTMWNSLSWE